MMPAQPVSELQVQSAILTSHASRNHCKHKEGNRSADPGHQGDALNARDPRETFMFIFRQPERNLTLGKLHPVPNGDYRFASNGVTTTRHTTWQQIIVEKDSCLRRKMKIWEDLHAVLIKRKLQQSAAERWDGTFHLLIGNCNALKFCCSAKSRSQGTNQALEAPICNIFLDHKDISPSK